MIKKLMILLVSMMTAFTSFVPAQAFPSANISANVQTSDVQQVRDRRILRGRHDPRNWNGNRNHGRYDRRYDRSDRYDRRYRRHNNTGAIIGGLAAGAIIGGAIAQSRSSSGSCASRYRSYRASDQTYQPTSGPRRRCID